MKLTVIYHSADYDGIFCREIARKFLPDAELIGWNFGDALIDPPPGKVYVLDLSPDCLKNPGVHQYYSNLIWIDHHKTSIENWPWSISGYRIEDVAACRLAWQWFTNRTSPDGGSTWELPGKQMFTDRKVSEPLSVRLAGEYDVWDKRDPRAETFQYGLRTAMLTDGIWIELLEPDNLPNIVLQLLERGEVAQYYAQSNDAHLVRNRSYRLFWEGLDFLVLNTGLNSLTLSALDVSETGHDALMGYIFNGKCWTVSLYHARHRTDLDLSVIAKKYGGGGHRGACGFTCDKLPFHQ